MSAESRLVGTTHIVSFTGLPIASPRGIFTTVTRSPAMVANWVDRITVGYGVRGPHNPQVVGLAIRSQPELHVADHYPIALLQLCVGSDCLIYQLLHRDAAHPPELSKFFDDSRFCFVGEAATENAIRLSSEHGFSVRNRVELADAVAERLRRPELRLAGLYRLMREVMAAELEMPEEVQLSSWQQRVLQPQQVAGACADAFISYQIGKASQPRKSSASSSCTFQPKLHVTGNCSIALLQLCVGSDCLIYQLLHRDAAHPPELLKFFDDSRFCFVGDTMKESTDQLLSEHGFLVRNTMELVDAVVDPLQSPEMQLLGQDPLMIEVMGAEIDMPEEVLQSSWQQRVLQPQQIAYACADAFINYQIGTVLLG